MTLLTNLDWALKYAARGWPVIPCCWPVDGKCGCGKGHDPKNAGKAPLTMHGSKDATTDKEIIIGWWIHWGGKANIGIATGPISHLHVLDIDNRENKDGDSTLKELQARYERLPETIQALTGGGYHLYYRVPSGVTLPGSALGHGIDTRGQGGYVIAPPSLHASGRSYVWEASAHLDDTEIATLPDWTIRLLERREIVPAEIGPISVSEAAQPPPAKLAAMMENIPEFERLWSRQEKGGIEQDKQGFTSDSAYDWAIGRYMMAAGWTDQEVVDGLIYHALIGNRPYKAPWYYKKTVSKLRGDGKESETLSDKAAEPPPSNDGERRKVIDYLNEQLDLQVDRIERTYASKNKAIQGEATYVAVMANGARTAKMTSKDILSFKQVQARIYDAAGKVLDPKYAKKWGTYAQIIANACEDEDLGEEATEVGEWTGLLEDYFASQGVFTTPEAYRAAALAPDHAKEKPFMRDGQVMFYIASLQAWLRVERGERHSAKEISTLVQPCGCRSLATSVRDDEGRVRSLRVWVAPDNLAARYRSPE